MRSRRLPQPPPGLCEHLSRREVARLLGFGSDFPVRRLEQEGRLRAVRGAMGQAWYPRAEVLAVRDADAARRHPEAVVIAGRFPFRPNESGESGVDGRRGLDASGRLDTPGRWTDAALIGLLRELAPAPDRAPQAAPAAGTGRPRTVVDLVADTGIGIARAARVYRFWLRHDSHPTADLARRVAGGPSGPTPAEALARPASRPAVISAPVVAKPAERRAAARLERDGLIRKLRDPDPTVRARAFEKLRPGPAR